MIIYKEKRKRIIKLVFIVFRKRKRNIIWFIIECKYREIWFRRRYICIYNI